MAAMSGDPARFGVLDTGSPKILVIGDAMVDTLVIPDGPLAYGADRRAKIRVVPGGSGANQAAWLAAEGVSAIFAGRIGAEDHAHQSKLLAECGVVPVLAADEVLPTGSIVTLISPDGERSFFTDRGANQNLCRADLADNLLDGVVLVHVSGYALFGTGPRTAVLEFLAEAGRRGIAWTVDAASHSFLAEAGADAFLRWTRDAAICFANASEAEVLTGTSDRNAQARVLGEIYSLAVIKAGPEGAVAADRLGGRWSANAPAVDVIDASGAGDAFLAGFLGRYLRGAEIPACLEAGVRAGARAVTVLGGRQPAGVLPVPG